MDSLQLPANIFTAIVGLEHVYICIMETFLFRTRGRRVFGVKRADVDTMAPAAANQV